MLGKTLGLNYKNVHLKKKNFIVNSRGSSLNIIYCCSQMNHIIEFKSEGWDILDWNIVHHYEQDFKETTSFAF